MSELELPGLVHHREAFEKSLAALRPELHRYCARMMGAAIDGEDVLQETLAKAFFQLGGSSSMPPLRPWLLRIAHNTALDHLKRHERRHSTGLEELEEVLADPAPDPGTVRAALGSFLALPVSQRSAVILKDVLGLSTEDIAQTLQTTVPAVKSALVRGRATLKASQAPESAGAQLSPALRASLDAYVARFNARDWDGLRALLAREVELELVGKASRRGQEVSQYFTNYAKEDVRLALGHVDGRVVLGAFRPGAQAPFNVMELEFGPLGLSFIRDYRYLSYLGSEVHFQPL